MHTTRILYYEYIRNIYYMKMILFAGIYIRILALWQVCQKLNLSVLQPVYVTFYYYSPHFFFFFAVICRQQTRRRDLIKCPGKGRNSPVFCCCFNINKMSFPERSKDRGAFLKKCIEIRTYTWQSIYLFIEGSVKLFLTEKWKYIRMNYAYELKI